MLLYQISHVLNEQGTGNEFLKSIVKLKNGPYHLKEHPKIRNLQNLIVGLNAKGMVHF